MSVWWRLWWIILPVLLWEGSGEGADFYHCKHNGEPVRIFPAQACQRLTDPTATRHTADAPSPPPPPIAKAAVVTPNIGPWRVTQILLPNQKQAVRGWRKQAMINGHLRAVGDRVAGGQLREIARTGVRMVHPEGETWVPFGQETLVTGVRRIAARPITLAELGKESRLLQWLAAGEALLIMHDGAPLARLLPVK